MILNIEIQQQKMWDFKLCHQDCIGILT